MRRNNTQLSESGNILIYILGAIFLLGLLIVIVKGSSTPGSNIDKESLLIRVSEVQQYGEELERAVAYVMRNGHSEADIRFAHPDANSAYGDITDTPSRQIFSRQGGGAKYRQPPADIQTTTTDWVFTAANSVGSVGSGDCTTNACADLIAILGNVTKEFCIELNKKANVENPGGDPVQDESSSHNTIFAGAYVWQGRIREASPATVLTNTPEGCYEGGGTPPARTYHYYRVLMAR